MRRGWSNPSGSSPSGSRTVSAGSSARTVPAPTRMASLSARSRWASSRAASPVIHWLVPSGAAVRPSRVAASLSTTKGRPVRAVHEVGPQLGGHLVGGGAHLDGDAGGAQAGDALAGHAAVGIDQGHHDPADARRHDRVGTRARTAPVVRSTARGSRTAWRPGPPARPPRGPRPRRGRPRGPGWRRRSPDGRVAPRPAPRRHPPTAAATRCGATPGRRPWPVASGRCRSVPRAPARVRVSAGHQSGGRNQRRSTVIATSVLGAIPEGKPQTRTRSIPGGLGAGSVGGRLAGEQAQDVGHDVEHRLEALDGTLGRSRRVDDERLAAGAGGGP